MSYPEFDDPDFFQKLSQKYEFHSNRINNLKPHLFLEPHQIFAGNYLSDVTPYDNLLLYNSTGTGKSISAINVISQYPSRPIIILVKNKVIQDNFKRQLEIFQQNMNDSTKYNITFINYGTFVNRTLGTTEKETKIVDGKQITKTVRIIKGDKLNSLSDSVIIVDEVHNIINNDTYIALRTILNKSSSYKLVLLSATPMVDNIKEIFELSNLLNDSSSQLPIRENLTKSDLVSKIESNSMFSTGLLKITKKGKDILSKHLVGKISYLTINPENFPSFTFKGTPLLSSSSLNVIHCNMSDFQFENYQTAFNLDVGSDSQRSSLFKNSSEASTIVYPNGDYGKSGFNSLKKSPSKSKYDFLKLDLQNYSSKLHSLLNNITKSPGPVLIYTELVEGGGIELLELLFKKNNITSFRVLHGKVDDSSRKNILSTFNSPKNKTGSLIKILVGSSVIAEGITLKRVRQVHLLEPSWNLSRVQQVIGRAIRNRSHEGLPEKDKHVDIFLYVALRKNSPFNFIDKTKYLLAEQKDKNIKQIERLLKKNSVDCHLNLSRNILPSSLDNSRQCDYKKCIYKCKFPYTHTSTDYSTLNIHFRKREINFLKSQILDLFKSIDVITLSDLTKNLQTYNIFTNNVYEAIQELIDDNTIIKGKNISGTLNYVSHNSESYYFIDNGKINSLFDFSGKYIQSTHKSIQQFLDSKGLQSTQATPTPRASTTLSPQQISKNNIISSKPIFGKTKNKFDFDDGKFRIVDNRDSSKDPLDKRKINLGKVCTFYDKNALLNIASYLSIPHKNSDDRTTICNNIQSHLKSKDLILY